VQSANTSPSATPLFASGSPTPLFAARQLASFEADLRSRGDFEIGGGFKIGDEVAARINEAENLWILCRITQFFSLASQYEVSDIEDTTKRYTLPADYIVLIPEEGSDDVMAHRFQKVSATAGMCSCRPQRRAHSCHCGPLLVACFAEPGNPCDVSRHHLVLQGHHQHGAQATQQRWTATGHHCAVRGRPRRNWDNPASACPIALRPSDARGVLGVC